MRNELELQPLLTAPRAYLALPSPGAKAVKEEIEKALLRVEEVDTKRISVAIDGNSVVLRGDVKSWREHEAASKAAAGITGVTTVQNELRVAPWMF